MHHNSKDIELLDKQIEFVQDMTSREILYSGAYGSGKSNAIAWKLYVRASIPGAREGLCRKQFSELRSSTLKTLLEGDGANPPILPAGTYNHNKSEKTIKINGGGEIQYFGLDDPDKKGSYNFTGVAIDESAELTEADYTMLRSRIRSTIPNLPNQIYAATNPRGPEHYLAKRFGFDGSTPVDGCKAITATMIDNPYLPAPYVADMKRLTGVSYKRYFLGQWVGNDGLVYATFDKDINVVEQSPQGTRIIVAVDDGFNHPFAALRIHIDSDGRMYVEKEHIQSGMLFNLRVALIESFMAGAEAIVVDPSALTLIAELANRGYPVVRAINKVVDGIERVRNRLGRSGDGIPRLTISPTCTKLIGEFSSYEYKKDSDEVVKAHDDGMDALRYGISYEDKGTQGFAVFSDSPATTPSSVPTQEQIAQDKQDQIFMHRGTRYKTQIELDRARWNDDEVWNRIQ